MNILIVEDDLPLGSVLQQALERERHKVTLARDGECALRSITSGDYGLILLDLRLPGMSGLDLLRHLRSTSNETSVLVVSGSSGVEERVRALDSGADDFLAKPFSLMELTARVRALNRRSRPAAETTLRVADLVIDRLDGSVERGGRRIQLTSREYSLLELLALNQGQPVSRTKILKEVWGCAGENASNIVDVYVNSVMRKIVERSLRQAGVDLVEVVEAGNGQEALNAIVSRKVDLILSDINMPVMDGLEFVRRLKKDNLAAGIPIVMITTEGSEANVMEALSLGARGYIRKPFTPEQVKEHIVPVLGGPQ